MKKPFKRSVVILAAGLLAASSLVNLKTSAFSGSGSGVDQSDPFVITTCAQLQEMEDDLGAPYILGNDIDCSNSASWNNGDGFNPIGDNINQFIGRLEGYGHTISNLTINRPNEDYVGLFGYMGPVSSILNTRLKNVSIVGDEYVGAVAGATTFGDILGVGADGSVNGTAWTGGLAGLLTGTIIHGYANVEVTSDAAPSGGLAGESTGIIFTSYSRGLVNGTGTDHGGLVGINNGDPIADSFWDTESSNQSVSDGGTGKTSNEMKDINTYTDQDTVGLDNPWDFGGSWAINPPVNQGYPYLSAQIPGVPDTFILSPPPSPTSSSVLTFEFASTIEPATFECNFDSGGYEDCSTSYTSSALSDGEYTFAVRATNADGLTDQTPAQITVVVDNDAPNTALSMIDPPIGRDSSVYIFSSDEPATFECSFNGADFETCTSPYTTPVLTDGVYTLEVRATDEAGNVEDPPAIDTWDAVIDLDGDSIIDAVENAGPNDGDANHDSILDAEQINVASFLNFLTEEYMVIETDCLTIGGIELGAEASDPADVGYDYPMGLTSFSINCENPGDTAQVRQYYYGIEGNENYSVRKWFNDGSYGEIPGYELLGMPTEDDVLFFIQYDLTDGSIYDDDGEENSMIFDPSGPAVAVASTSSSSPPTDALAETGGGTLLVSTFAVGLIATSLTSIIGRRKKIYPSFK